MLTPEEEAEYRRIIEHGSDEHKRSTIRGAHHEKWMFFSMGLCCIIGALFMGLFGIDQFYTGSTSHLYKGDLDSLYVNLGVWTVLPILIGLAIIVMAKRRFY